MTEPTWLHENFDKAGSSIGFRRKWSAPARRPSSSIFIDESMTMKMCAVTGSDFRMRHAWMPFISGISMSRTIRSGFSVRATRIASRPVDAVRIRHSARERNVASRSRKLLMSSTSRIVCIEPVRPRFPEFTLRLTR